MAAIGILGGMGPQASAQLYKLLIKGTKAYTPAAIDSDYPEIVLLNVPVPLFISDKKEINKARKMLIERTILLEQAGCIVNGIACNTAHILLPDLQAVTKVPFLSIPELVAKKAKAAGFERVGLLATPTTLTSTLYDEALDGVELTRPNNRLAEKVEDYVYKELADETTSSDRVKFRRLVSRFKTENSLDAVILGCTELPLIYGEGDETIIDTIAILSDALLETYFRQRL